MTPEPKPVKDLKVAVVGGGVSGVLLVIALEKRGIEAQLYESAVSSLLIFFWRLLTCVSIV